MAHRKTAVAILCLAVICGAAVLWAAYKEKAIQRKLGEDARLYRVRAEQGDKDAQSRLGSVYYYGQGVRQDYAEAVRWYRKAADQGDAKAQFSVGVLYHQGKGVPQDYAEAARWLGKAAEQGEARAQYSLGVSYAEGQGVPQNYAEAARWCRKAAEQGDPTAQHYLGYAYRWGRGVPQNYADAARWYRKAAEQGDEVAQGYLGVAYQRGQGVPRDYVEAVRWYLKVVGAGALRCMRHMGWTSFVTLLLALVVLVVPKGRWRRARWLSWALLSGSCAAYVLHTLSGSFWTGWGRVLIIVLFAMLSAISALTAVTGALRGRNRRVDPSRSPMIPEGQQAALCSPSRSGEPRNTRSCRSQFYELLRRRGEPISIAYRSKVAICGPCHLSSVRRSWNGSLRATRGFCMHTMLTATARRSSGWCASRILRASLPS